MSRSKAITTFTSKNAAKLFIGIFVSVISIFALVYMVQQPLFQPASQASSK